MTNPLVENGSATNSECQLPVGISMPKPLSIAGNLATNCNKYKWSWENYAIVAKHHFENDFQRWNSSQRLVTTRESLMMEWISTSSKIDKILKLSLPSSKKFASARQMRYMNLGSLTIKYKKNLLSVRLPKSPSCSWNDQVWPVP